MGIRGKAGDVEGKVPISKEAADRYLADTMRAQHLSTDRPEMQVECRGVARKMQQSSNLDETGLKRLAPFLGVHPRLILDVQVAKASRTHGDLVRHRTGCIRTSKSLAGCALMLGVSTVCTYCKGQAVIALSSGEAECYGLVSVTSQMLSL